MGLSALIGKFTVIAIITFCCLSGHTNADTLIVDDDGFVEFNAIQDAIDAASDGDLILVYPGIYNETIDFLGKEITVESSSGASVTTIDANQKDTVVYFWNNETDESVLDGFTLTGGIGYFEPFYKQRIGGAIFVYQSCPTIRNCTLVNNSADAYGGAVYIDWVHTQTITVENCSFMNNSSDRGGAIYCARTNLDLDGCNFIGNTALFGGAIEATESGTSVTTLTMTDCVIGGNTATQGGGMRLSQKGVSQITNCVINNNEATASGYAGGGCIVESQHNFINCTFTNNTAVNGNGGAVSIASFAGASPSFTGCEFSENTGHYGGAIYASGDDCTSTFTNCTVKNNFASLRGGGLNIEGSALTLNRCSIMNNSTTLNSNDWWHEGGGIFIGSTPSPTIANCIISGNIARYGGGITAVSSDVLLLNSLVYANDSLVSGGGVYARTKSGTPQMHNSIVWGNNDIAGSGESSQLRLVAGGLQGNMVISNSIIENWTGDFGGVNNSGLDPRWVDPLGEDGIAGTLDDDLHLHPTSPCIDAGNNANAHGATDFDGGPRFLDDPYTDDSGSGKGAIIDIGIDEYVVALVGDAGPRLWMESGTPSCMFDDTDNWLPGEVPDLDNLAMFEVEGEANVCLGSDAIVEQLIIANGDIYLDLDGSTLTSLGELRVAPFGGKIANLTVTGGSFGATGEISGQLVVDSLDVGGGGIGSFNLDENVTLIADEILMRYGASIDGEPTLESDMNNFGGRIRPGINSSGPFGSSVPGLMVINGDYAQVGSPDLESLPRYGSMEFDIDPSDTNNPHDYLQITGHALLSGILELNFDTSYVTVGNGFDIFSATSTSGEFDLLYARGLQNGEVAILEEQLGVSGDSNEFSIEQTTDIVFGQSGGGQMGSGGDPTGMIAVDLDQQGGIDVVISRLGSSPTESGVIEIYFDIYTGTTAPIVIPVGLQPQGLDSADIDGDGDLDIAVVNAGSDTVSILTNNGSKFSVVDIEVTAGPVDLAFGDFITANPSPDLAVAATESDAIDVLENILTARGSDFIVINTIGIGRPKDIDPGDVNNDKDLDYISNSRSDSTTTAQTGDGQGGANSGALQGGPAYVRVPIGGSPRALKVTDMNGDNLDDTLTINGDGSISLRLGLLDVAATISLDDPRALNVGDLDNDGDKDIVVSAADQYGDSKFPLVLVIRNDTSADVISLTETTTSAEGIVGSLLAVGDVDGDGFIDIVGVTGDLNNPYIEYWLNETGQSDSCVADLDDSGVVGVEDLLMVIAGWGPCNECLEDLDGDGVVRVTDLLILIANWGDCF